MVNLPLVFEHAFQMALFLLSCILSTWTHTHMSGRKIIQNLLRRHHSGAPSRCCREPVDGASWGPGGFSSDVDTADPCWHLLSLCLQIRGTDRSNGRELHIAYRHGEHYDSVRRLNDNSEAPARLQTEVSGAGVLCSQPRGDPVGGSVPWSQKPGTFS